MTRALGHFGRLDFQRALEFHALVFLLWPTMFWCALCAIVPCLGRKTLGFANQHDVALSRVFWAVLGLFGVYGTLRIFGWIDFPAL